MNRRWVQNTLVAIIVMLMVAVQSFDHQDKPVAVVKVIEQSKQVALSDASKNELALYREAKYMTGMGDDR